jgi:hypothetical protein
VKSYSANKINLALLNTIIKQTNMMKIKNKNCENRYVILK